ncbi:Oligo-1,6-glucosidase [Penicillium rolfsii]|nr:Oligo-1,6-glucosidase [Penicillium rolfsii]
METFLSGFPMTQTTRHMGTGSACEYGDASGEYHLHLFAKEQPDLNKETIAVRAAVENIMRYWLDRGIDSFRMDVINFISKNLDFPDALISNPDSIWQNGAQYYACAAQAVPRYLDILVYGSFELVASDDSKIYAYARHSSAGTALVIFNFELKEVSWTMPQDLSAGRGSEVFLSNYYLGKISNVVSESITPAPLEAFVLLSATPSVRL